MKRSEAQREANRRWTNRAAKRFGFIQETDSVNRVSEVRGGGVFEVGYTSPPLNERDYSHFNVQGTGSSWEAAFADADRREEEFRRQVEDRRVEMQRRGRAAVADIRAELKRSGSMLTLVGYGESSFIRATTDDEARIWSPFLAMPDDPYLRADLYRGEDPDGGRCSIYLSDAWGKLVNRCAKAHKVGVHWNNGNDFWFAEE